MVADIMANMVAGMLAVKVADMVADNKEIWLTWSWTWWPIWR